MTPKASATATATPEATSPAPTPTENPYGIAPAFDSVSASIDAALQELNTVRDFRANIDIFRQELDRCNEVNVQFDDSITTYDLTVVSSCGQVYQVLEQTYKENPAPQIKEAMDNVEGFTFGTNGKIEDLNSRGKLTLSYGTPPTVAGYEARLHESYFVPLQ